MTRLRTLFYCRGQRFGAVAFDAAEFLTAVQERTHREIATEADGNVLVLDPEPEGELRMRAGWHGFRFFAAPMTSSRPRSGRRPALS